MSNERDELFQLMLGRTTTKAVERILAAGYRKPRTITTAEELDALLNGSVVLSTQYTGQSGQQISFQRWYDGDWHRGARSASTHPDNFLPVVVLYEPEPQP